MVARTTSPAGASLPTKPEAPASMAAKIWSSPECMVSTISPIVGPLPAQPADDVQSGAVGELQVGHDGIGRELLAPLRAPRRPTPASATTSVPGSRSNDVQQSLADQLVVVDEHHADDFVGHDGTALLLPHHGRGVGSRSRWRFAPKPGCRPRDGCPTSRSAPIRRARSFMISSPCESARRPCRPRPLSATTMRRRGWVDPALDVDLGGLGVAHRVVHRLLRDAQQLGLDLGAQPGGLLVDGDRDRARPRPR